MIARSQSVALDSESHFTSLPNLRLTAGSLVKEVDYQIEGLNVPIERLPIIQIPGDSPWVCKRVLLWTYLLNTTSSMSQAKLARPPYE